MSKSFYLHVLAKPCLQPMKFYNVRLQGDFFFGASFLWTTSTLPLQLRWFQETSGVRRGVLYQLNNLALLLSFLACRICIVPYLMHTYGTMKGGLSLYQARVLSCANPPALGWGGLQKALVVGLLSKIGT